MSGDYCQQYKVGDYIVQENGIVRDSNGDIIGRLSELESLKEENDQLCTEWVGKIPEVVMKDIANFWFEVGVMYDPRSKFNQGIYDQFKTEFNSEIYSLGEKSNEQSELQQMFSAIVDSLADRQFTIQNASYKDPSLVNQLRANILVDLHVIVRDAFNNFKQRQE